MLRGHVGSRGTNSQTAGTGRGKGQGTGNRENGKGASQLANMQNGSGSGRGREITTSKFHRECVDGNGVKECWTLAVAVSYSSARSDELVWLRLAENMQA